MYVSDYLVCIYIPKAANIRFIVSIYSATDSASASGTQDFVLTINNVDEPPSFGAAGGYSAAMATATAGKYHRCVPHYADYAYD